MFRWKADKLNDTGLIEEIDNCKINRPISDELNIVMDGIFHCIRKITGNLDDVKNEKLSIYLGATAGMRLLNQMEPNLARRILDRIRNEFQSNGMNIKRISIISGQEEGMFAWIAANYLSGTLFKNKSIGILDMGGASAQIARAIQSNERQTHDNNNDDDQDYQRIRLFGNEYNIYTFSNICFGAEQALFRYIRLLIYRHKMDKNGGNNKMIDVPCFPRGFRTVSTKFSLYNNICTAMKSEKSDNNSNDNDDYELIGTGQLEQCQQDIEWLLNREKCEENFRICFKEITNSNDDDEQERQQMNNQFYAISSYYHETKVLRFEKFENISRLQYLNEYHRICMKTFDEMNDELRIDIRFTSSMCFRLPFIIR